MLQRLGVETVIGADHFKDSISQGVPAFCQRYPGALTERTISQDTANWG